MYFFSKGYQESFYGCRTELSGWMCKFPFIYQGQTYSSCTKDDHHEDRFWCSISNFPNGTMKAWDHCVEDCVIKEGNQDFLAFIH